MLVVEKLKLNRYRPVSCISPRDLFHRVGERVIPDYVDGQTASFNQNTMDALDQAHIQFLNESDLNSQG